METLELTRERIQAIIAESAHVRGELAFLEELAEPGMTVMDIGGNKGLTTIRLAQAVGPRGRVFAFEPVPEYCEALRRNVARHGLRHVTCCNCALGLRPGTTPYFVHGEGSGIVEEEGAVRREATVLPLDRYAEEKGVGKIGLLSMDCEGSELYVLQGAERVLRRWRPRIFCEVHPGALARLGISIGAIAAYLETLGYAVTPVAVESQKCPVPVENCSHLRAVPEAP